MPVPDEQLPAFALGLGGGNQLPAIALDEAPPILLFDADFANALYTLNGEEAVFGDIFASSTWTLTAGVGLQVEKTTGNTADNIVLATPSPAVKAVLLGQSHTIVVDYIVDRLAATSNEDGFAHHSVSFQYGYQDAAFTYVEKLASLGHHGGPDGIGNHSDAMNMLTLYNYDYDSEIGGYADQHATARSDIGTFYASIDDAVWAYFGHELDRVLTEGSPVPFPDPLADSITFHGRATSHEGTALDKENVAGRITIQRIRAYTPAQSGGWTPNPVLVAVADFKNGEYTLNGATVTYGDLLTDRGGALALSTKIVPGVGVVVRATYAGGATVFTNGYGDFTAGLRAELGNDQLAAVLTYRFACSGLPSATTFSQAAVSLDKTTAPTNWRSVTDNSGLGQQLSWYDYDISYDSEYLSNGVNPSLEVDHILAAYFTTMFNASSRDGGDAYEQQFDVVKGANRGTVVALSRAAADIGSAGWTEVTLEKVEFYRDVSADGLPSLSGA